MPKAPTHRVISGRGSEIYEKILKPLFNSTIQYDRAASYYSPYSLVLLLNEFANVWKHGGTIRLVIGFHERMDITPALKTDKEISKAIKDAVTKAMAGQVKLLKKLLNKQKNIFPALKEIINQHGLYVKLVTPKANFEYYRKHGRWPKPEKGIFHSKFIIMHQEAVQPERIRWITRLRTWFRRKNRQYYQPSSRRREKGERYTVVTGSMNESVKGYTDNIEDAIIHRSWVEPEHEIAAYFVDRFEEIWLGHDNDVVTMPFTEEFCQVIKEIEEYEEIDYFTWERFTNAISDSPVYQGIAYPIIGLLPHQIGVYTEALGRWPIRVLLADEVGLGKTIEAGAIIHYLKKYCGIKRVLILTPASLRKQWQEELKNFFDLNFWNYNSIEQVCERGTKTISVGKNPLSFSGTVDNVIVSWHWARLGADEEIRFKKEDMPDLLVVDEAHHARIHEDLSGESRTKLHVLLKKMQEYVPHVILMTATPYQTDILDYYSLMDIIGVPEDFLLALKEYSKWARGTIPKKSFNTQVKQLRLIHRFISDYQLKTTFPEIQPLEKTECKTDTKFYEDYVRKIVELHGEVVIGTHPTTFLATRNYRSNLKELGYHFPESEVRSPDIEITKEQAELLQNVEEYISQHLGTLERITNAHSKIGLMRSLYRQRIVSSIRAAADTLQNRKVKLQQFIRTMRFEELRMEVTDEFDSSVNDENDAMPDLIYDGVSKGVLRSLADKAKNEIHTIDRLLFQIKEAFQKETLVDPKIVRLRELLQDHVSEKRKVLVFSRFTSTTSAIVDELTDFFNTVGVGRFDGTMVGVYKKRNSDIIFEDCSRQEIVSHLKTGRIGILVCSDAASEGLNLHYANVAINVDVPWNPSRLLQRFGRVDRLGQKADKVYLTNLYYPNSIEEKMYRVLEDRRTDFRSILGEVPEIMSQRQKNVINDLSKGLNPSVNLTLAEIERERKEYLKNQLFGKTTLGKEGLLIRTLYEHLLNVLKTAASLSNKKVTDKDAKTIEIEKLTISLDPLNDDFVSLGNSVLSQYEITTKKPGNKRKLRIIENNMGEAIGIAIDDDAQLIPITSKDWPLLFAFCFEGEPIDVLSLEKFSKTDLEEMLKYLRKTESWIWPDYTRISSISAVKPDLPTNAEIRIGKELGYITIVGS